MSNEVKKTNKKLVSTPRTNKILKIFYAILAFLYIVLIIFWVGINKNENEQKDIYKRFTSNIVPVSIKTKDALYLKELGIERYKSYILNNDFESAYNMLTDEYKSFVSFEKFPITLYGIDFTTVEMADIKARNDFAYEAKLVYKQDGVNTESTYYLYPNKLNAKNILISPNNFIYHFKDKDIVVKDVELIISSLTIFNNKIVLDAEIKNKSLFDNLDITSISVAYDNGITESKDVSMQINKNESKTISINYEGTKDLIPNNIKIVRRLSDEKERTYTFYFNK